MRQMLLRVPDELHTRLARTARQRSTSVNALANEILDDVVPRQPADKRTRLREKARELGVLVELPAQHISSERRATALESTKGMGPVLDEIFEDGR